MRVLARPVPHIRKECGPRFPLPLHTFYTLDYPLALAGEVVFSGCYVR